ncbi:MAG: lipase family protein [Clostridia bacterium]|nr:lipase family protein [Clostridia bacterium]
MNREGLMQGLEMSAQVYGDVQPSCPGECICLMKDPPSGVEYAVHRSADGALTIIFRGTDSLGDWRSNFLFAQKTVPYGNAASPIRVHEGFLKAYKSPSVRERILGLIDDRVRRVRITGHSRGAALAVLCAVDVQYHHPNCCLEVLLFGCPRVGNAAFAKSYNKRVFQTYNVSNGGDLVHHLPPALLGYRHVGIRLHVGRSPWLLSAPDHQPRRYYGNLMDI